jgi:hypothetical protein
MMRGFSWSETSVVRRTRRGHASDARPGRWREGSEPTEYHREARQDSAGHRAHARSRNSALLSAPATPHAKLGTTPNRISKELTTQLTNQPGLRYRGSRLISIGMLGTAPTSDVLAHVFGLLVGGLLGIGPALARRQPLGRATEWLLALAASALVLACWRIALAAVRPP